MSIANLGKVLILAIVLGLVDRGPPKAWCQDLDLAPDLPPPMGIGKLVRKLADVVKFDGWAPDPKFSLQEGLDHLAGLYDLKFRIDERAFSKEFPKAEPVSAFPIIARGIPKMTKVPLSTVLDKVLAPVDPPVTYRLCSGTITIIPRKHADLEELFESAREFVPNVSIRLYKLSVKDALENLVEETGISIVVDSRCLDQTEKAVLTTTMNRVPIDTAAQMLADMADLKTVVFDGAIYVTNKANAEMLQQEQDKKRQQRQKKAKTEPAPAPKPEPKDETPKGPK